jgi:hypothetical protein
LFIAIDSEIVREGVWVEGRETIMRCDTCGWDGDFNKEQPSNFQCFVIYSIECA